MSINPFDDGNGRFSVLVNDGEQHSQSSPMFPPAGGWFAAKPNALRVWTTSNRTGINLVLLSREHFNGSC